MVRLSHHEIDERSASIASDGRLVAVAAALLTTLSMAAAQTPGSAGDVPAGISERARRDAESPFRWIKIHSESARKAEERKAAAAVAAAPAPAPAPAPAAAPAARPARGTGTARAAGPLATAAAAPATSPTLLASTATTSQSQSAARAAAALGAKPAEADEPEALVSIDKVDPEWDEDLLRTLRKGRVLVRFHVAEDGYLSRIQIVESSHSKLTGPAMAAVMQWRFEPIPEPRVATVEFGFDVETGRR